MWKGLVQLIQYNKTTKRNRILIKNMIINYHCDIANAAIIIILKQFQYYV